MLSEEITDPKIGDPIELQESTFVHGFDVVEDCGGGRDENDDENTCDGQENASVNEKTSSSCHVLPENVRRLCHSRNN